MKRATRAWLRKAESDYAAAVQLGRGAQPFHDERCFHCQQAAEKLLKELGHTVPKTHDLIARARAASARCKQPVLGSYRYFFGLRGAG